MTERLFVYGMLCDPNLRMAVFKRSISGTPDTLHGYQKSTIAFGMHIYPIIQAAPGQHVDGLLLEVSADELARSDHYETHAYRRIKVTLASGVTAWVYGAPGDNPSNDQA
jgi:gamma-glutamylcyclotransferase (GGCT)/AIG2-like uncharacterized protein YtfP